MSILKLTVEILTQQEGIVIINILLVTLNFIVTSIILYKVIKNSLNMIKLFSIFFRLFEKALCVEDLDDKCDLANAWERFERCYGTNKTLEICLKQCEVILTYVKRNFDSTNSTLIESRKRKIGNVTKNNRSSNSYEPTKKMARTNMSINENTRKTKAYKIENNKNNQIDVVDRRNDAKTPQSHNNSIHKESSEWKVGGDEDKLRIFLSNLDYNLNEDEIRNGLPDLNITDIELVRSGNGRSRGFAYAKLPNEVNSYYF